MRTEIYTSQDEAGDEIEVIHWEMPSEDRNWISVSCERDGDHLPLHLDYEGAVALADALFEAAGEAADARRLRLENVRLRSANAGLRRALKSVMEAVRDLP